MQMVKNMIKQLHKKSMLGYLLIVSFPLLLGWRNESNIDFSHPVPTDVFMVLSRLLLSPSGNLLSSLRLPADAGQLAR